jgi:hypothetical protein
MKQQSAIVAFLSIFLLVNITVLAQQVELNGKMTCIKYKLR